MPGIFRQIWLSFAAQNAWLLGFANSIVIYVEAFMGTGFYVFIAVPARLTFALAVAMVLNSACRGITFYRAAYYAPSIIGGRVTSFKVSAQQF